MSQKTNRKVPAARNLLLQNLHIKQQDCYLMCYPNIRKDALCMLWSMRPKACICNLSADMNVHRVEWEREPRWQGETIRGLITEVKQLWAWSILGWVTIQDTVLAAKDVIVTCCVPLWLMSYEHTRGSQSAP